MQKDDLDEHSASREFIMLVPAQTQEKDSLYQEIRAAVREGKRSLPSSRKIAISLGDCTINAKDKLCWRNRVWVPECEPLRTGVI
ncbi:hypothetical protein COCSADRAFT_104806 [Bipolaris sorokiniana ND90Pr]|uniref:Uncharacterized protein n=1 Tax=Cochliobolus sativus (strain ND90Pr / ATCC 201652) TaxID=665912 RepID=M2S6V5_COCSN|nr:uncharacterized protein COCSADRAFT_104806 [Bipolaris sorokiniana ND90Pr]EMD58090.1 hypothetical protein COCSADRAFT_104806 [Bipolaris sorokiniana ND90Pr]